MKNSMGKKNRPKAILLFNHIHTTLNKLGQFFPFKKVFRKFCQIDRLLNETLTFFCWFWFRVFARPARGWY